MAMFFATVQPLALDIQRMPHDIRCPNAGPKFYLRVSDRPQLNAFTPYFGRHGHGAALIFGPYPVESLRIS